MLAIPPLPSPVRFQRPLKMMLDRFPLAYRGAEEGVCVVSGASLHNNIHAYCHLLVHSQQNGPFG